MYTNIKQQKKNNRFFYTSLAVIACIMLACAVVASPSFFVEKITPDTDPPVTSPGDTVTAPPLSADPPVSSDDLPLTEDTTASPVTDAPTITEPPVATAPPETSQTIDPPETSSYLVVADAQKNPCVLTETADAGQDYLDKIIFLGDSTTYSFLYYGKLSGGKDSLQVWTPAARTLTLDHASTTTVLYPDTNEEITVNDALEKKQPEILIITLGVNGISYMKEEYFKSSYKKLVQLAAEASPDTEIILQSIFPVAKSWEKTKSINNEKINAANQWIRDVADDCGVRYLDTITALAVDPGGYLPESYQNGDGLHLNSDACGIVLNYIRTHALPDYTD